MTPARRTAAAFLAFLPMAPLGTVCHEAGHWAAAELLGTDAQIHYALTTITGRPSPWITAGGPAQTMATGTLGLAWLAWRRRADLPFGAADAVAALLALFWSREVFNLALALLKTALGWPGVDRWDEYRLSLEWLGDPWILPVLLGALGLAACLAALALLPRGWRLPALLGGLPASLLGFAAWMHWLGPLLLP